MKAAPRGGLFLRRGHLGRGISQAERPSRPRASVSGFTGTEPPSELTRRLEALRRARAP